MVNYELGQFVKSMAGRDAGEYFIVIDIDDLYIWLVNGKNRRLEAPKRKKKKHVQITHTVAQDVADKLNNEDKISNAEIRRSLKDYLKED